MTRWAQAVVRLPAKPRGCHLVTEAVLKEIGPSLKDFNVGLCHLFSHFGIIDYQREDTMPCNGLPLISRNSVEDLPIMCKKMHESLGHKQRAARIGLVADVYPLGSRGSGDLTQPDVYAQNYDPDVRHDTETFFKLAVPEGPKAPWSHTMEGPDDMPGHIKSSMFGCQLSIPVTKGALNLGTWQGIWLCEHRDRASGRTIVVTIQGD